MQVEECCQKILREMLPDIDKQRSGLAIDIGVGTFLFYCQMFEQLKFNTVAVEPLPTTKLRKLCNLRSIRLIESCVSDVDGYVDIYIGSFNGKENLNLSSMSSDWWGSSTTTKQVKSMSLSNLFNQIEAKNITCMKIDVEGMELSIIQQFLKLENFLLPKVLVFEYGGEKTFINTIKCLDVLKNLGYRQTIMIDSKLNEHIIDLSIITEFSTLFPQQSAYGNIISMYGDIEQSESKIKSICQSYYNTEIILQKICNYFKKADELIKEKL